MKLPSPRKDGTVGPTPQEAGSESSEECGPHLRAAILLKERPPTPGRRLVSHEAGLPDPAGRGQTMATAEPGVHAARASSPAARPGGTPARVAGAAGPPSGRRGSGVPRLGERTPAAVEKRGPYMVTRAPSIQAKLRECGPIAGLCLGGLPGPGAGSGAPLGHLGGALQPAPAPENLFGSHGEWGRPR